MHGAARCPTSVGGVVYLYFRAREEPTESCALNFVPARRVWPRAQTLSAVHTRRVGRAESGVRALASLRGARLAGLKVCLTRRLRERARATPYAARRRAPSITRTTRRALRRRCSAARASRQQAAFSRALHGKNLTCRVRQGWLLRLHCPPQVATRRSPSWSLERIRVRVPCKRVLPPFGVYTLCPAASRAPPAHKRLHGVSCARGRRGSPV